MSERLAIFLQSASFEPAYQAGTLAITAAAMGDEVWLVLGFEPLRALAGGRLGSPVGEVEVAEGARAVALGLPTPGELLAEARALGARVVACDTLVRLAGLEPAAVPLLDESLGLPTIWRHARTARTVTF
ncbi:MAG: hypothetical protein FJ086_07940 [Deltaproteobacteria bacterium]|nr:hypothetical protein [Deltaproteobacteria bacterium]